MDNVKILYVDKEENNLIAFKAYFRRKEAFEIKMSSSIEDALTIEVRFHILIIDHTLLRNGEQDKSKLIFDMFGRKGTDTVKIIVTTYRDITDLEGHLASGELYDCLYKPVDFEHLGRVIEQAYASHFK